MNRRPATGKNRGISRNPDTCTKTRHYWDCSSNNDTYGILILESFDRDWTKRRLSPVAIKSENTGIIDLVNGPANHRGSHGYSALSRISTFFFIVKVRNFKTIDNHNILYR